MKRPLETVPVYAFYADPADEFDWFWSKDSAQAAFDDACTSTHYDTDTLQVLEVLVPVDVICRGRPATTWFISDQADRGPGRGVVELLRERPAKVGAQPCTNLTNQEPTKTKTKPLTQTLHRQLVQLRGWAKAWLEGRDSGRFFPCGGICSNLKLDDANLDLLRDLMMAWPAGTGCGPYPVPHPYKSFSQAYRDASNKELWNPEFEYARNRWALLEWLIEQTEPDARISIPPDTLVKLANGETK